MKPRGRSRRTWKCYTKMCLNAVRWKLVDWIHLAHYGDRFGEHGDEHSFCMKCGDICNYLKVCCYLERYVVQDKTSNLIIPKVLSASSRKMTTCFGSLQ